MLLPKHFPVTCHTQHVGPGSTFAVIKGFKTDGSQFITQALERGATKIVAPQNLSLDSPSGIEILRVKNSRKALAERSAHALGYPAKKLKIIGITGTKGKTTTTFLIEHILRSAGFKTALMGGIKNQILDAREVSSLTTPESDYIQMFLHECVKADVDYVVMEVSSHALSLYRTHGIMFDAVGFTNLDPEHLDFHQTLEKYFDAKCSIFNQVKSSGSSVINVDNSWGNKAFQNLENKSIPIGINDNFKIIQNSLDGLTLEIENSLVICPALFGEFNAYNIAMAYHLCKQIGVEPAKINKVFNTFPGVPGRLQLHTLQNSAKALVDFAHNPSSVKAILQTLRPLTDHLIVIFGCGGNKDKNRRPEMGKNAARFADEIILTDDNPRFEDRISIIEDILSGIPNEKHKSVMVELDRNKAIKLAASISRTNSIIAILGKGHETTYEINGEKKYFSDFEEISKL